MSGAARGEAGAGGHPLLDAMERVLVWLERAMDALLVLLMLTLVFITAAQLLDRHVIDLPMAAPDQYARVALVWLTFIGFALAVRGDTNVRVDLIDARLPPRVRHVLEMVFDATMLVLVTVVGWNAYRVIEIGGDQALLGTVLSAAVPPWGLLIGCVTIFLFAGARLILRLSGRHIAPRGHEPA